MSAKAPRPRKALTSAQLRKKYKNLVPVPKPAPGAYRPDRPISGLVALQLQHLQLVEQGLPAEHRVGAVVTAIKTEAQAASFVGHVTEALHRLSPAPAPAARAKGRRRTSKPRASAKGRRPRRPAPRARRGRRA